MIQELIKALSLQQKDIEEVRRVLKDIAQVINLFAQVSMLPVDEVKTDADINYTKGQVERLYHKELTLGIQASNFRINTGRASYIAAQIKNDEEARKRFKDSSVKLAEVIDNAKQDIEKLIEKTEKRVDDLVSESKKTLAVVGNIAKTLQPSKGKFIARR